MKYLALVTAFFLFSCAGLESTKSANTVKQENEVSFYRDSFYDYVWKVYDDTVKVKKPRIIGLNGAYPLEYRLTGSELQIKKHKYVSEFRDPNEKGELLFRQALTDKQQQEFKQIMRQMNMAQVRNASGATSTCVVDDGFVLSVLLTRNSEQEKLYWNNKYVEDLANLLSIVNNVSPPKYRFYKDKSKFWANINPCEGSNSK